MTEPSNIPELGVIALGNPLVGDDGAGVWIGEQLKEKFPNLWLRELGTDLLGIQIHSPYPQHLILLDAVATGAPPGTIHRLTDPMVLQGKSEQTPHALGPAWALNVLLETDAEFASVSREWIAIEAEALSEPFRLTPKVHAACQEIFEELCCSFR